GTHLEVDHGKAHLVEFLSQADALFKGASAGFPSVIRRHLDEHGKVRAAVFDDLITQLTDDVQALVEGAAKLVVTLVPVRAKELVYHVAAVGVQLDGVRSCSLGKARGDAEV